MDLLLFQNKAQQFNSPFSLIPPFLEKIFHPHFIAKLEEVNPCPFC